MDGVNITLVRLRAPLSYSAGLELQHVHGAELERSERKQAKLFFLQHTPVFTLGRKTGKHHLPCSEHDLAVRTGAEVVRTNRGGSVTYHGPGQLTAYLLLNLQSWNIAIHQHLDMLEETVIRALDAFGVQGHREPGMTGVWVAPPPETGAAAAKICAIGVSARRWITYHGLSLNVDLDLKPFTEIVPCGLEGKAVTSLAQVLGRNVAVSEAEDALSMAFASVYGAKIEVGLV